MSRPLKNLILNFIFIISTSICFSQQWQKQFVGHLRENFLTFISPDNPGNPAQLRLTISGNKVKGDFMIYPWIKESIVLVEGFVRNDSIYISQTNPVHKDIFEFVCAYDSIRNEIMVLGIFKKKKFEGFFRETKWSSYKIIYQNYRKRQQWPQYPVMIMHTDTSVQLAFNQFIGTLTDKFTNPKIKKCKNCIQYIELDPTQSDDELISIYRYEEWNDTVIHTIHTFDLVNKKELILK